MQSGKKITQEDTWRPADLRRHIKEGHDEKRSHRGAESIERRHRDPEKESRQERDKERERETTRERRHEDERDRYADRRKEGSRDRRDDKDRDRRDERERERRRERDKLIDGKRYDDHKENKDRRQDREEKHERERDRERHRDKEKVRDRDRERHSEKDRDKRREERDKERRRQERDRDRHGEEDRDKRREERDKERKREERDRERHGEEDRNKRREERDKERRREERDRERHGEEDRDKQQEDRDKERRREEQDSKHRSERDRRRREDAGEGERDRVEKHEREKRDRHRESERQRDEYIDKRNDKEGRERHKDRKHLELKEEREHKEEQRRPKEERERRHRERDHHDEKRRHDSEARGHRDLKGSGDEVRHHHGDREQADWDNHKERRHREEQEPERNHHRDSKKSTSDKSHRHKTKTEEVAKEHWTGNVKDEGGTEEPAVNDDLADQEYEEDFEDYEEDFEELDESANEGEDEEEPQRPEREVGEEKDELSNQRRKEIEAIQRAMDEENERVGTAQSGQTTSREEEDRPKLSRGSERSQRRASQRGKFIDFVAAKQREVSKKVATKQKKRSTELLRLIDLDFSMTFSLLDLPPVNEYDMYIRNFGTTNTKQAYVQCNEDNADRDIQTEEIEVCERWTQHPPEHSGACGDPNCSQETRDKTISEMNFDSQRLTTFLRSAAQVMVVLLEEDQAERKSQRKLKSQTDKLSFSDGSLQLNTKLPFLYGRSVSLVHFSQVQRHTMMSVHSPTTKPSAVRLDSCTIICIWNIWEPSRPRKVLVYESEVQCCCFSPGKAILVFAGTSVGSVLLWDLREHASNHYRLKIGEDEWILRQPTFSTDAVMADSGHFSSMTSVEVVPSTVVGGLRPDVPLLASEEESSGLSFQLASLDESGVLSFWVVVELPKANEAGSPIDLGLRPGGKVKLLHSSSLNTAERATPRDTVTTGPLQTLHLKFLPTDSNHFFIGTNMGLVNHGTSHGLKAPPKFYRFQEPGVRPVDVSSIHFSPFMQHFFLVGCGDGSIRLHAVSHELPVAEWSSGTAGEPVVSLQWNQTRPTVFCVLDAASKLHIWDLLKNDTEPVITERMDGDRVTAMAVFGDSGQQNTYSGLALAHESGTIEMHYFTRDFTVPITAEEEKLESMLTEA